MPSCFPLRRKTTKDGSTKESVGCTSAHNGSTNPDFPPQRAVTEGHCASIYRQRFTLGVSTADFICIPLHLRLRDDNARERWKEARRRREGIKKGGWVVWIDEDTGYLSSTTVSQWAYSSRRKWLDDCKARYEKRCAAKDGASTSPSKTGNTGERRVLYLFVLMHGMSPPALLQTDVVENFGNLIATILERFPAKLQPSPQLGSLPPSTEAANAPPSSASASCPTSQPSVVSAAGAAGDASSATAAPESRTAPQGVDGSPPASLLFIIYSYRAATWQSVAACMARIVPRLSAELKVLLDNWDEIQLFAVGHSLGGLLWRFVLLRRLQQLVYPDNGKQNRKHPSETTAPECYSHLLNCLQHPNLHLKTFCTLASPHVGAYKSSAVYRSMPRAVAGLRFLPNSQYAQELLLHNDKGFLAALAAEERAGRSHLTFPFPKAQEDACSSETSRRASLTLRSMHSGSANVDKRLKEEPEKQKQTGKGNPDALRQQMLQKEAAAEGDEKPPSDHPPVGLEDTPETRDVPGEVPVLAINRFEKVILYGILETDWIVSANSALATAVDLRRTPEGKLALENPMYPIHVESAICLSPCTLTNPASSDAGNSKYFGSSNPSKSIELILAQQHIDVFNHVSNIGRYIVYIPQNPLFLAPHSTLKGSPCVVTEAEQKKMRREAAPILEHVTAHLLQSEQQYCKRLLHKTSSSSRKGLGEIPTATTISQPAMPHEETRHVSIAETNPATAVAADMATVSVSQPVAVAEQG